MSAIYNSLCCGWNLELYIFIFIYMNIVSMLQPSTYICSFIGCWYFLFCFFFLETMIDFDINAIKQKPEKYHWGIKTIQGNILPCLLLLFFFCLILLLSSVCYYNTKDIIKFAHFCAIAILICGHLVMFVVTSLLIHSVSNFQSIFMYVPCYIFYFLTFFSSIHELYSPIGCDFFESVMHFFGQNCAILFYSWFWWLMFSLISKMQH